MSDEGRRLASRAGALGDSDAEVSLMLERARTGEVLSSHDLLVALRTQERQELLNLLSQASIPDRERGMLFLRDLPKHYEDAMETIRHYELVQEEDAPPPSEEKALDALIDHLRENPHHVEIIGQMDKPVFQMVPVYEPKGAGFKRMIDAIDAHRAEDREQDATFVHDTLRNRWGLNTQDVGKIVGWQLAVVEGAKVLSEESNRFLRGADGQVQYLQEQLCQWQEYCQQQRLQLCGKESYCLLQMREIYSAARDTPLDQLGLDPQIATYLEDKTRQPGTLVRYARQPDSMISYAGWAEEFVAYGCSFPGDQPDQAQFRLAMVVNLLL